MTTPRPAAPGEPPPVQGGGDVRLRGFAARASLEEAQAWVDAQGGPAGDEEVAAGEAVGRTLALPPPAPADVPPSDRAADDGFAVRAAETAGASVYNPIPLRRAAPDRPLPRGAAALVSAGGPLPPGADAVLPFEALEIGDEAVEAVAPAAEGAGVERAGRRLRAGEPLLPAGRPLSAHRAGLLGALAVDRVRVFRRPRVRLVIAGPRSGGGDAHGPMLRALVARDGGLAEVAASGADLRGALPRAVAASGADLVIATGRSGTGEDDLAPWVLAEVGRLALHGVALRPGGSTGMGTAAGLPVLLLPGDPLACLCAYELLAGRLVRRLAGRDPALPHASLRVELARKLASAVGCTEVFQVRLVSGRAEPLGLAESGGLPAACGADGFVVVPAALEGYPPGTLVTVHAH